MQMEQNDQYAAAGAGQYGREGNGQAPMAGRNTVDSQRTLGGNDVRVVNGVKYEAGQPVPVGSNF